MKSLVSEYTLQLMRDSCFYMSNSKLKTTMMIIVSSYALAQFFNSVCSCLDDRITLKQYGVQINDNLGVLVDLYVCIISSLAGKKKTKRKKKKTTSGSFWDR